MALGVPSVGEAGKKADLEPWSGTPPRDEFYWLSEINKATFVTNTAAGLLDRKSVRAWCEAQERVSRSVSSLHQFCAVAVLRFLESSPFYESGLK